MEKFLLTNLLGAWGLDQQSNIIPGLGKGGGGQAFQLGDHLGSHKSQLSPILGAFSSTSSSYCSSTSSSNRMSHCLPFSNPSPQWNAIAWTALCWELSVCWSLRKVLPKVVLRVGRVLKDSWAGLSASTQNVLEMFIVHIGSKTFCKFQLYMTDISMSY